jgi:AcrR family transcriptional regulator
MVTKRVEKKREAARHEILDVARRQMAKVGAGQLSLRAIARELEMTAPALYRYFDSRDAVITELIVEAYNSVGEALEIARNSKRADAPGEQLLATLVAYREWALAHPQDYALVFGTPLPDYEGPVDKILPAAKRAFDMFVGIFEMADKAGRLKPDGDYAKPPRSMQKQLATWRKNYGYTCPTPALHLALVVWARTHGLITLELFHFFEPFFGDATELYEVEVRQLITQAGFRLPA